MRVKQCHVNNVHSHNVKMLTVNLKNYFRCTDKPHAPILFVL